MISRIVFLMLIISAIALSGCSQPSLGSQLEADECSYTANNELICGSSWIAVHEGIEYNVEANKPLKLPRNMLVGLVESSDSEDAFLIWTETGTFKINEETSEKALGSFMISG